MARRTINMASMASMAAMMTGVMGVGVTQMITCYCKRGPAQPGYSICLDCAEWIHACMARYVLTRDLSAKACADETIQRAHAHYSKVVAQKKTVSHNAPSCACGLTLTLAGQAGHSLTRCM